MRSRVFLFRGMQGNSAPPLGAPSLANGAPGSASHRGAPEAGPGTESAPSLTLTPHPPWRRTERRAASASKEFPFKEEGEMFSFSSSLQDKPTIQAVLCQTNKRRRDLDYLARSFFSFLSECTPRLGLKRFQSTIFKFRCGSV